MANGGFFREPLTLNDEARAALPTDQRHAFVELSGGVTHYQIAGPEDGPPVVLIHGFSVPLFLWDHNFHALADAGFRVVRYDLFGRGYSDRIAPPYNEDVFDRQTLDLIDVLGMDAPSLVGSSMGGGIAITFADRHPDRVGKLVLVGPVGFGVKASWAAILLYLPGIGEITAALTGNKLIIDGLADDFLYPKRFIQEYADKYKPQMAYRGFKRAILSTMRRMSLSGMAEAYARVGQQERDVLLIWGRHDQTIPLENSDKALAAIPQAALQIIEDAGHIPHYERPEVVNPLLVDFLS